MIREIWRRLGRLSQSLVTGILSLLLFTRLRPPVLKKRIAYSDIYKAKPDNKKKLIEISTESINGRYLLYLPNNLVPWSTEISGFINKLADEGSYDSLSGTEEENRIKDISRKNALDGFAATLVFIVMSIVSILPLQYVGDGLIFAIFGALTARQSRNRLMYIVSVLYEIVIFVLFIYTIVKSRFA